MNLTPTNAEQKGCTGRTFCSLPVSADEAGRG